MLDLWLIVREVRSGERFRRRFEMVRLDNLLTERQASSPDLLAGFGALAGSSLAQHDRSASLTGLLGCQASWHRPTCRSDGHA